MRSSIVTPAVITAGLVLAGLSACSPATRAKLEEEVLRADPSFADALDKHRELTNRIETYKREYGLKRSTVERDIVRARRELASAAATVRHRTAEARQRLEPERQRLNLAIAMAAAELHTKQVQRSSLGRSVAQIKKALGHPDTGWSAEERAGQEGQVKEMLADATRLDHEIATLRSHIRLLKIKLHLLRL